MLLTIAGVFSAGILFFQATSTSHDTTSDQASYGDRVVANQIAASGMAIARAKAAQAGANIGAALASVRSITPVQNNILSEKSLDGGTFQVIGQLIDGQNLRIEVLATFGDAIVTLADYHRVETLVVSQPSRLEARYLESTSVFCSAIWIQRIIPANPGDVFDLTKGSLSPDGSWYIHKPEMLFDSDHNRSIANSYTMVNDINLKPGTRLNFLMGVDQNCSQQGVWKNEYSDSYYDQVHYALQPNVHNLDELNEGRNAIVQTHKNNEQRWRVAFEDVHSYSGLQHADVKKNGYGSGTWDAAQQTYWGTGWSYYSNSGYFQLSDQSGMPDFNDQVFEPKLIPCGASCPPEGTPLPELDD